MPLNRKITRGDWDGYDTTGEGGDIALSELSQHYASDAPVKREDDGFVGLNDVNPTLPDPVEHLMHDMAAEVMTRPTEPPRAPEKVKQVAPANWSARNYTLPANTPVKIIARRTNRTRSLVFTDKNNSGVVWCNPDRNGGANGVGLAGNSSAFEIRSQGEVYVYTTSSGQVVYVTEEFDE